MTYAVKADVYEWLHEHMDGRRHVFTRRELDLVEQVASKQLTTLQAAQQLGVHRTTFNAWMLQLGYRERSKRHESTWKMKIPWDSPLRCQRCGILLQYVDYHRDGLCDWCLETPMPADDECVTDPAEAMRHMLDALATHEDAVAIMERRVS